MRKRYHFWPGLDGLDAWDVHRLIELSADLAVEEILLDSIDEVDSVYWFRPADLSRVVKRINGRSHHRNVQVPKTTGEFIGKGALSRPVYAINANEKRFAGCSAHRKDLRSPPEHVLTPGGGDRVRVAIETSRHETTMP